MSQTLQTFQNNSLNKTQVNRFPMISSARAHIKGTQSAFGPR